MAHRDGQNELGLVELSAERQAYWKICWANQYRLLPQCVGSWPFPSTFQMCATPFSFKYAWTPWLMLIRPSLLPHDNQNGFAGADVLGCVLDRVAVATFPNAKLDHSS